MAILDIIYAPHPLLNETCHEVTDFNQNLVDFVKDMYETMHDNKGIGLAAPQVGILDRICICEFEGKKLTLINPKIIQTSGSQLTQEGCLSIPNENYELNRYETLEIQSQDLKGEFFTIKASGMMAIIIQHEMDHLDGVLISTKGKLIKTE